MSLRELTVVVPEHEVAAIEYPAFVRNTNRAIQTLGGIDAIATAVNLKQQYLKLKHRPEDRTSHPLYGERVEHMRLLLRIAQPRTAPAEEEERPTTQSMDTDPASTNSDPAALPGEADSRPAVTASLVARVTPTFRFPGLADFAFIPHDPLLLSRKRESLPYDQRPDRAEPTKAQQPFLLIPQLFSWLDLPQDYAFRQLHAKQAARGHPEPSWGDAPVISFYAEGVPPPVATTAAPAAAAAANGTTNGSGDAPPPAAPGAAGTDAGPPAGAAVPGATPGQTAAAAAAGAPAAAAGVVDVRAYRVLETEVSRLLAQRPVWGLELLRERCARCAAVAAAMPGGCDAAAVERVVQRLCYRFKTGPWRGLFIRRGYDPRVDAEARKYQALVYSLPNNRYRSMLKSGVKPGQQRQQQPQPQQPDAGAADGETSAGNTAAAGAPTEQAAGGLLQPPKSVEDLYNFRTPPVSQTTILQLCDLQLPEVQSVLQEAASDSVRCSEKTGWYTNATLQQMQNAVQQRFLQLMEQIAPSEPEAGAADAGPAAAAARPRTAAAGAGGAAAAAAAGAGPSTAGGDGGDVEMADAAGPAPARAAAADDALRALMAQMNLRGMAQGPSGAGGGGGMAGVAGLFGDDDEDDEFRLLDEQDDGGDGEAARMGTSSAGDEMAAAAARGTEAADAADGGGGRGGGAAGRQEAGGRRGDATDGEESAMESEYDVGFGSETEDDGEEDDQEDEQDDGGAAGGGSGGEDMYGPPYDAYGRVEVPYDGGPAARQQGDYFSGMFGSDDEDY